jgi:hypothetical protein
MAIFRLPLTLATQMYKRLYIAMHYLRLALRRLWFILLMSGAAPATAAGLELSEKIVIVRDVADMIEKRYVLRDRATHVARSLRADAANGRWRDVEDPKRFADLVTDRLQELSKDGHLALDYAAGVASGQAETAEFRAAELERWYGAHLNHGFEKIERLPGNIGYLDLRVFAPNEMAGDVTAAAMTTLAQSSALIIDLRRNGGGIGMPLVAAYLFDKGAQPLSGIYDRPSDKLQPVLTPEWVPGRRFGSTKPVYILISKKTFSAAEAFAYDLQALKRATIVGERSGGGANPFEYRPVRDGFFLSLSEQLSVNPITGKNWQDVGVMPDVPVPADQALAKAAELATAAIKSTRAKPASTSGR